MIRYVKARRYRHLANGQRSVSEAVEIRGARFVRVGIVKSPTSKKDLTKNQKVLDKQA